jgi:hypothetical protein
LGSICGTTSAVFLYARFVHVPWRTLLPSAAVAFIAALIAQTASDALRY